MIQNIRAHGWNRVEVKSLPGRHGCFWNVLIFTDDEAHDGAAEWIKTSTEKSWQDNNTKHTVTQHRASSSSRSADLNPKEKTEKRKPLTHITWEKHHYRNSDRSPHLPSQLEPQKSLVYKNIRPGPAAVICHVKLMWRTHEKQRQVQQINKKSSRWTRNKNTGIIKNSKVMTRDHIWIHFCKNQTQTHL